MMLTYSCRQLFNKKEWEDGLIHCIGMLILDGWYVRTHIIVLKEGSHCLVVKTLLRVVWARNRTAFRLFEVLHTRLSLSYKKPNIRGELMFFGAWILRVEKDFNNAKNKK